MTTSPDGLALLKRWEGCRLVAYRDSAAIATIGYGATTYEDGSRVQIGDTIDQAHADRLLAFHVARHAAVMDSLTTDALTQPQFDALTCLVYNIGEVQYRGSTLRQRVNANPNDPSIRSQFQRWHKAKGRPVLGLWLRRHDEADLYFQTKTPVPPFPKDSA